MEENPYDKPPSQWPSMKVPPKRKGNTPTFPDVVLDTVPQ